MGSEMNREFLWVFGVRETIWESTESHPQGTVYIQGMQKKQGSREAVDEVRGELGGECHGIQEVDCSPGQVFSSEVHSKYFFVGHTR